MMGGERESQRLRAGATKTEIFEIDGWHLAKCCPVVTVMNLSHTQESTHSFYSDLVFSAQSQHSHSTRL